MTFSIYFDFSLSQWCVKFMWYVSVEILIFGQHLFHEISMSTYTFSKKFLQSFILRHTHLCFSALEVLAEPLCRRGFLENCGIDDYLRWYNSHSTLLYFTYTLTSRLKWLYSRSQAHSYIYTLLGLNLLTFLHHYTFSSPF